MTNKNHFIHHQQSIPVGPFIIGVYHKDSCPNYLVTYDKSCCNSTPLTRPFFRQLGARNIYSPQKNQLLSLKEDNDAIKTLDVEDKEDHGQHRRTLLCYLTGDINAVTGGTRYHNVYTEFDQKHVHRLQGIYGFEDPMCKLNCGFYVYDESLY